MLCFLCEGGLCHTRIHVPPTTRTHTVGNMYKWPIFLMLLQSTKDAWHGQCRTMKTFKTIESMKCQSISLKNIDWILEDWWNFIQNQISRILYGWNICTILILYTEIKYWLILCCENWIVYLNNLTALYFMHYFYLFILSFLSFICSFCCCFLYCHYIVWPQCIIKAALPRYHQWKWTMDVFTCSCRPNVLQTKDVNYLYPSVSACLLSLDLGPHQLNK